MINITISIIIINDNINFYFQKWKILQMLKTSQVGLRYAKINQSVHPKFKKINQCMYDNFLKNQQVFKCY